MKRNVGCFNQFFFLFMPILLISGSSFATDYETALVAGWHYLDYSTQVAGLLDEDGYILQPYLQSQDDGGIDAIWAWTRPDGADTAPSFKYTVDGEEFTYSGRGEGVNVIDIEPRWYLSHETFPELEDISPRLLKKDIVDLALTSEAIEGEYAHGTAVLGTMSSKDIGFGTIGIANQAHYGVISPYHYVGDAGIGISGTLARAKAILEAANYLERGDILLLELGAMANPDDAENDVPIFLNPEGENGNECAAEMAALCEADSTNPECISYMTGDASGPWPRYKPELDENKGWCNGLPVEFHDHEFNAIKSVIAKGIVVVECAGNGKVDLDDPIYGGKFDRNIRDSGAILVGASSYKEGMHYPFSSYGSIIDVHAWGIGVTSPTAIFSTETPENDYMMPQSGRGTSIAGPIVAGICAIVQGYAKKVKNRPLTPAEMRTILSKDELGQTNRPELGVMPSIKKVITYLDTYLDQNPVEPPLEPIDCWESTNIDHANNGRAYSEYHFPYRLYYAAGSEIYLGTGAVVTSLENPSEGYFHKLDSCD